MNTSSMVPLLSQGGHSAIVNMHLIVDGITLPIAQMGPDYVVVLGPINHPPSAASLVMQVDQSERCWSVHLPDGIVADNNRVKIASCA